jgi:hypothetical protein
MDPKNKDKIKNIVARSFRSLPVAADLPRLAKQIRVFKDNSQIYPPSSVLSNETGQPTWSVTDGLQALLAELSKILIGASQEKTILESFPQYFRLLMKKEETAKSPEKKPAASGGGLDSLEDKRLREALVS